MSLPASRFTFTERALRGSEAILRYRLEGGGESIDLEERFTLPEQVPPEVAGRGDVQRALLGLHVMAGVSYWKATLAPEIALAGGGLDARDAAYFTEAWSSGLGEFFCRNELALDRLPRLHGDGERQPPPAHPLPRPDDALVLLGGGKDSAVSVEVVRRTGARFATLSVGSSEWIARAAKASGAPHISMGRRVDPALATLNARGALNGHVPISAILAHATLLYATVAGVGSVLASNERSASFGNVRYQGVEVNHQWSKGLRFERMLGEWSDRNLPGGARWTSLLRPMSELHIAEQFARLPRWFDSVTSCNANFRLDGRAAPMRWCGRCPKCVFVYAIVAPFLDDEGARRVFGRSILDDAANIPMAAALCGVEGVKPFECVGTPDEARAALHLASQHPREASSPVVRWFREAVPQAGLQGLVDEAFALSTEHALTPRWHEALRDYLG